MNPPTESIISILKFITAHPGCTWEDLFENFEEKECYIVVLDAEINGAVESIFVDDKTKFFITTKGEFVLKDLQIVIGGPDKEAETLSATIYNHRRGSNRTEKMLSAFIYKHRVPNALIYIRDHPGCLQKEVFTIFGGTGTSIVQRVDGIVHNGLVERTKEGGEIHYRLTDLGAIVVDHIMAIEDIIRFSEARRWHTTSLARYSWSVPSARRRSVFRWTMTASKSPNSNR